MYIPFHKFLGFKFDAQLKKQKGQVWIYMCVIFMPLVNLLMSEFADYPNLLIELIYHDLGEYAELPEQVLHRRNDVWD